MRKQGFLASSVEMPNEFNCSSIRINEQDELNLVSKNKNNLDAPKISMFRQFEENSLNGLQGSLSISTNRQKILELMHSKSVPSLQKSVSKKNIQRFNSQENGQGISLYGTGSFDDMTMKMTIQQNTSNVSNLSTNTHAIAQKDKKGLKRPQELKQFKATYTDSEMKHLISNENKIGKKRKTPILIEEQKQKTREYREQVEAGMKNITELIRQQNAQENVRQSIEEYYQPPVKLKESLSNHEPTFKNLSIFDQKHKSQPEPRQFQQSQQTPYFNRPRRVEQRESVKNKASIESRSKFEVVSPSGKDKKLTLRDYLNLNNFMTKPRQHEIVSTLGSRQKSPKTTQTLQSPRESATSRRKVQSSNAQVMSKIKKQIYQDIRLIQSNLEEVMNSLEQTDKSLDGEPEQEYILYAYKISQIIKEKMKKGNDQLSHYIKEKSYSN